VLDPQKRQSMGTGALCLEFFGCIYVHSVNESIQNTIKVHIVLPYKKYIRHTKKKNHMTLGISNIHLLSDQELQHTIAHLQVAHKNITKLAGNGGKITIDAPDPQKFNGQNHNFYSDAWKNDKAINGTIKLLQEKILNTIMRILPQKNRRIVHYANGANVVVEHYRDGRTNRMCDAKIIITLDMTEQRYYVKMFHPSNAESDYKNQNHGHYRRWVVGTENAQDRQAKSRKLKEEEFYENIEFDSEEEMYDFLRTLLQNWEQEDRYYEAQQNMTHNQSVLGSFRARSNISDSGNGSGVMAPYNSWDHNDQGFNDDGRSVTSEYSQRSRYDDPDKMVSLRAVRNALENGYNDPVTIDQIILDIQSQNDHIHSNSRSRSPSVYSRNTREFVAGPGDST
jgi:hypothetical protein